MREDVIKHRQKAHQVLHLVAILNQNSNDSRPTTTFADSAAYDGGGELEERVLTLRLTELFVCLESAYQ